MKKIIAYFMLSLAILFVGAQNLTAATTINFDNLPTGTNVTNQYPQVAFSATGFSAGAGGPFGYNLYTRGFYKPTGYSNAIVSEVNSPSYYGLGDVYLQFLIPVNNVSFYLYNSVALFTTHLCYIDVYANQ